MPEKLSNGYELNSINHRLSTIVDSNANVDYRVARRAAVEVKDARFTYGKGERAVNALQGVTFSVPQGGIFGLLGPSGCGKTTLLRALVGQHFLTSGEVTVFGEVPCSGGLSMVPGPGIGYMPQELALFPDLTIEETLVFFGRLYLMKPKILAQRIQFLVKFLSLPGPKRMVGELSGGQKRRVSLAVSLVHNPPLLILDEPTVGVDPVLRQTIWDHLVDLRRTQNLTVIITTHYIEEARAADSCAFMRAGRLLRYDAPNNLLHEFGTTALEEVFLTLCELDAKGQLPAKVAKIDDKKHQDLAIGKESIKPLDTNNTQTDLVDSFMDNFETSRGIKKTVSRIGALFGKNVTRLRRNLPVLLFQFLLPSIEVILFCVCIGADPFNIPVAVFNRENPPDYSARFLQAIDTTAINLNYYDSGREALKAVKDGKAWSAIVIKPNFTTALNIRQMMGSSVSNETISNGDIHVYPDMSNQLISFKVQKTLLEAFQKFSKSVLVETGQNPNIVDLPVKIETPVYGIREPAFTDFMAPGVLLSITFLAAVALTALAFVMERKEGLLERSLVAGVTSFEYLLSHILTQLCVLCVQLVLLLIFTFIVFRIPCHGSFVWVIIMLLLQGGCGMGYGLMISSFCKEENSATMLALGSFYPNLLLSGTVWPIQAMPDTMRWFAYFLPQTIPIESLRYIMSRGWDASYTDVAAGFGVTLAWTALFLLAAFLIFRYKK